MAEPRPTVPPVNFFGSTDEPGLRRVGYNSSPLDATTVRYQS